MRDIVSPLAGFSSPFGRGADPYAILGYRPPLVLDYENSKFRVSGSTSTAPSVVTATRTGLATQLNSAGNLVWNAHNLLRYSEDFSNAAWFKGNTTVTANAAIAPNGTTTADQVDFAAIANANIQQSVTVETGAEYQFAAWIWADSAVSNLYYQPDGGADQTVSVGTEPTLFVADAVTASDTTFQNVIVSRDAAAATIYIWGAHLYRSDLGGMAPVPLTRRVAGSTTYVPTTSAAVYLPREEAYTYVSGSLAGPYYQKESDARTNLVTYSEDFTSGWVNDQTTDSIASGIISPDGSESATQLVENTALDFHTITNVTNAGTAPWTASIFIKQRNAGRYLQIRPFGIGAGVAWATFDPSDGSVFESGGTGLTTTAAEDFGDGWYRVSITCSTSLVSGDGVQFCLSDGTSGEAPSYTGDGTSGVFIYGAQLEQGSTPTSYIPTSGSTVTRSADSTTIAAGNMPYPTPQVIGPELVTNGTFDTDSDWTKSGHWVISGGKAEMPLTTSYLPLYQAMTFTAGSLYLVEFDVDALSGNLQVVLNDDPITVNKSNLIVISSTGRFSGILLAQSGAEVLAISRNGASSATVDNVSVREINPLALSFQMEGLMTYADEGLLNQVEFLNWEINSSNLIYHRIRSDTATNDLQFGQANAGTFDSVTQAEAYSPGINVPFNIASRHGSTFINGAVDGTALTADTTPTALPDLSATTFDLAPTFNGFIKEFRVWADDIGDTGIAEAST